MERPAAGRTGTSLRLPALLVAVEGAGLCLLGAGYAASGLLGRPQDRLATVLEGVLALLTGLGLLQVARGLAGARRWALAPTVVAQALLLVVGWGLLQARAYPVGVPLVLLAAVVLGALTTPGARAALRGSAG